MELKDKTILITGAAKRIGKATAIACAKEGANVIIHYHTSHQEAENLKKELMQYEVRAWTLQADLGDGKEVETTIEKGHELAGNIDVLINNASIFPKNQLVTMSEKEIGENMQVNAFAPLQLSTAFYKKYHQGAILNFLDTRITQYDPLHAAYHLSKRTLFTLTRMMALEFSPHVRVNAVAPGLILPPPGEDESFLKKYASHNPLNTYGTLENVTSAVLFLLKNDFVTGQILYIDGGSHTKGCVYGL